MTSTDKEQLQQIDTATIKAKFFNIFGWFSTTVGALTLFSSVVGLIELAPKARWLVDHWNGLIHFFWKNVLFFLPHVSELEASFLTIVSAFLAVIILSSGPNGDKKTQLFLGILAPVCVVCNGIYQQHL